MKNNIVGWFEIPVKDLDRAIQFYQDILDIKLERNTIGTLEMAWFPFVEKGLGASGSLIKDDSLATPSDKGILIYFTSPTGDITNELNRVEKAGGKLLTPKTLITPEIGFYGMFLDTEGNKVAIHSRK